MKNIRKIGLYLLFMVLLFTLVACETKTKSEESLILENEETLISEYPIEVVDSFGNRASIESEPKKIISLAPNNTEILFALGLEEKIIGVTSYCDYPEEASEKEIVGSYGEFNLEKIIELDPDLVLVYGQGDEDENEILKAAGINILGFMPETIDEVIEDIKKIGIITGKDEKALEISKEMKSKKNEIMEKLKGKEKIKVFYEIWHEPLQAAGEDSFIGELIELAGGENIAVGDDDENLGGYPLFDLEKLIEKDPEVYLTSADIPEKTIESIKQRPGYENISAVKNNRVYLYEGNEANILSRPGPRIIEALEILAKSIHPEIFE